MDITDNQIVELGYVDIVKGNFEGNRFNEWPGNELLLVWKLAICGA